MGRRAAAMQGALPKALDCDEHGPYYGSVLYIGDREYESTCPWCDINELRIGAWDALADLGKATMAIRRNRRPGDREFFVRLVDDQSASRVAVGNFWAESDLEAIKMAEKEYPGLFGEMQTRTWVARAEPTGRTVSTERSIAG